MTRFASSAVRPRSSPRRRRSMPRRPVSAGVSRVWSASLPIATPASLTPCSNPQIHHGRLPRTARVSGASGISTYVQRTVVPGGWRRAGTPWRGWHSVAGRSLFFAKSVRPLRVSEPRATSVSQLVFTGSSNSPAPRRRVRPGHRGTVVGWVLGPLRGCPGTARRDGQHPLQGDQGEEEPNPEPKRERRAPVPGQDREHGLEEAAALGPLEPEIPEVRVGEARGEPPEVMVARSGETFVRPEPPSGEVAVTESCVDRVGDVEPALHGQQDAGGKDRV